jgi:hypothetical protein
VGKVSKAKNKKRKELIKIKRKKTWERGVEKIELQEKTEINTEKGQRIKSQLGMVEG